MTDPLLLPYTWTDIPAEEFPVIIQFLDENTLKEKQRIVVEGPGVVKIPGFGAENPTRVRVWYSSGMVVESRPDGTTSVFDMSKELGEVNRDLGT